jgi:hypothetical protein
MSILSFSEQHRLNLKLRPVLTGELFLARKLKNSVYVYRNGSFEIYFDEGSIPRREQIGDLIKAGQREVFVFPEDHETIKNNLQQALIKVTRSLSVGDPGENGNKNIKLLCLNMGGLYSNPHSDELLMLQFQSTQSLSKFLIDHKKFLPAYFQSLNQENFHFTLTQPMLSSLMLISFLHSTHLFNEREIENLFLASYFKDIGFSLIPGEKYDEKNLSERDKQLFSDHADYSFKILEGRIPLSKSYLNIIKNHHFLNEKLKTLFQRKSLGNHNPDMVLGLESTLVAVFDILVAMISERPYRKSITLYQALEVIKKMMADDYPQEFRALVVFLRQFFKN